MQLQPGCQRKKKKPRKRHHYLREGEIIGIHVRTTRKSRRNPLGGKKGKKVWGEEELRRNLNV